MIVMVNRFNIIFVIIESYCKSDPNPSSSFLSFSYSLFFSFFTFSSSLSSVIGTEFQGGGEHARFFSPKIDLTGSLYGHVRLKSRKISVRILFGNMLH